MIRWEAVLSTDLPGAVDLLRFMRERGIVRRPTDASGEFVYLCDRREAIEELVDVYWRGRGEVRARVDEEGRAAATRVLSEYVLASARNYLAEGREPEAGPIGPRELLATVETMMHEVYDFNDDVLEEAARSLGIDRWKEVER